MSNSTDTNGWIEYKKLFEHLVATVTVIDSKLDTALIKIGKLEERSKMMSVLWGSMGGGLAVLISVAAQYFS